MRYEARVLMVDVSVTLPQFCGDAGDRGARVRVMLEILVRGPSSPLPLQPQPPRYAIAGGNPSLFTTPHLSSAGLFHSLPPGHTRGKVREPYGEPPGVTSIRLFLCISPVSPSPNVERVYHEYNCVRTCGITMPSSVSWRAEEPRGKERYLVATPLFPPFPHSLTYPLPFSSFPFHSYQSPSPAPPRRV